MIENTAELECELVDSRMSVSLFRSKDHRGIRWLKVENKKKIGLNDTGIFFLSL